MAHTEVDLGGGTGYVLADDLEPTPPPEPSAVAAADARPDDDGLEGARLVPRRRTAGTLFDSNGNAGPTVWWDGRVVGGWSQRRDGEIVLGLLEDVGARRVARRSRPRRTAFADWVGDVRFSPGFLPPFQRALAT